jgi:hypothetical protein
MGFVGIIFLFIEVGKIKVYDYSNLYEWILGIGFDNFNHRR